MIIDTHAHYDDEQFDTDRDELLKSMHDGGIGLIVNAASTLESWGKIQRLTEEYPFVYGAVGIHPDEAGTLTEEHMSERERLSDLEKIVAVGEIGLDYYWDNESHDVQKKWFIRQLELAKRKDMPVIIHSREAAADTMEIMRGYAAGMRAVIHCYSYSPEMAREYVKMGYYIGVGGVVTFKNAKKLKQVVQEIPLESVVLETDWTERGFFSIHPSPVESVGRLLEHLAEAGERVDCFNTQPLDEVIDSWLGVWEEFPSRGRMLNYPVNFYDDTLEYAVKVATSLLQSGEWRPKAVLCTTLSAALGLSRVLYDSGFRVGQDVRLAAVNDVGWAAYLTPSITTLESPDLELLTDEALEILRNDPGAVRCLKSNCRAIRFGESSRIPERT